MAENALYISSLEHNKPTVFELVAQESLMNTLHPSFNLLCKVLKLKLKKKLDWFFKYQEEYYLIINFLIQSHYMRQYNGSFSETFYGLKRLSIETKSNSLTNYSYIMSLFCIVGLPYLNLKLKRFIESKQLDLATNIIKDKERFKIRYTIFLYKSFNSLYEILRLYSILSYLSGFSDCHHPLFKICKVKLTYHNIEIPSWKQLFTNYFKNKQKISNIILPIMFKLFSQFLEISAFTIQFLNWWHSDDVKTKLNTLPIPPPLILNGRINKNRTLCPICNGKRKIEVVLQSTGYVYCYRCIKEELDKFGKCPVTNLPATAEQLIRIYSDK